MTDTTAQPRALSDLRAGDTIHFRRAGLTVHKVDPNSKAPGSFLGTFTTKRGQVAVVTDALLQANVWLRDPIEQTRRWGEEVVGVGPWPADLRRSEPGSLEEAVEREALLADAERIADPREREQEKRRVRREFTTPSSTTLQEVRGSDGLDRAGRTYDETRRKRWTEEIA